MSTYLSMNSASWNIRNFYRQALKGILAFIIRADSRTFCDSLLDWKEIKYIRYLATTGQKSGPDFLREKKFMRRIIVVSYDD